MQELFHQTTLLIKCIVAIHFFETLGAKYDSTRTNCNLIKSGHTVRILITNSDCLSCSHGLSRFCKIE
jgi:hypothetical protein